MHIATSNLAELPIHLLAPRLEQGEISPLQLLQACLARIKAADPVLHAFLHLTEAEAIAAAERAGEEIAQGQYRGKLHGIPFAVKDLLDVAGLATTAGSAHLFDNIAETTATVVVRAEAAGAILLGKVQMVEFAFGGWGTNTHLGAPRNPWDLVDHRSPGGSSSGSGVAVAAGMVGFSLGSDTGGSIRSPAAMNGVVGLKPTLATISTSGVFPLSQTLDSIGPLTRSVEDAALVFAAICGPDPLDPATWNHDCPDVLAQLKTPISGMRLAVLDASQLEGVCPDVLAALEAAVATYRQLGATVETITLPLSPLGYCTGASQIIRTEAHANLAPIIAQDRGLFDPHVKARILAGAGESADDFAQRLNQRRVDMVTAHRCLEGFDALLLPATPIGAPKLTTIDENAMPLSDYTRFVNYLGLCALALPNGRNREGMPLSLQIVAPAFREDLVLQLGWAFENATEWHAARPNLSSLSPVAAG